MNVGSGDGSDALASDEHRNRQKKHQYVDLPRKHQNNLNLAATNAGEMANNDNEIDNSNTAQRAKKNSAADVEMNEDQANNTDQQDGEQQMIVTRGSIAK